VPVKLTTAIMRWPRIGFDEARRCLPRGSGCDIDVVVSKNRTMKCLSVLFGEADRPERESLDGLFLVILVNLKVLGVRSEM